VLCSSLILLITSGFGFKKIPNQRTSSGSGFLKTFQIKEPKNLWISVFENFRIKEVFEFKKRKKNKWVSWQIWWCRAGSFTRIFDFLQPRLRLKFSSMILGNGSQESEFCENLWVPHFVRIWSTKHKMGYKENLYWNTLWIAMEPETTKIAQNEVLTNWT